MQHELELYDPHVFAQLMTLCATKLQGQTELLKEVFGVLTTAIEGGITSLGLDDFNIATDTGTLRPSEEGDEDTNELPLDRLVPVLVGLGKKNMEQRSNQKINEKKPNDLTERILSTARRAFRASVPLPKQIVSSLSTQMGSCSLFIRRSRTRDIPPTTSYACLSKHSNHSISILALWTRVIGRRHARCGLYSATFTETRPSHFHTTSP